MSLRRSERVTIRALKNDTGPNFAVAQAQKRTATVAQTGPRSAKRSKRLSPENAGEILETAASKSLSTSNDFKKPATPATPKRERRKTSAKMPPLTPTPSLISVIRAPYSSGDIDDTTPPPLDRPVEPHISNAPLVTPGGTQIVAYSGDPLSLTPSKTGLPPPTDTTGSLLDSACTHLVRVDPRLKQLIERFPCPIFSAQGLAEKIDPFRSLSSGIMGQQVSGAAAKAIKNKFIALFSSPDDLAPSFPSPAQVVKEDIARLRLAGLSQRKAEYIKGLAEKFVSGELSNSMLMKASDDEVMERLIAVRGLGKWSVEMFACFALKRMDIFSVGDLGVQRGMAAFFGKNVQKLKAKGGGKWKYMSEEEMLERSAPFAPYRSLFMWYMWRADSTDIGVMVDKK